MDSEEQTHFAPARRADPELLATEVELCFRSPIADAVLRAFSGVVLVLNQQRQIVAVNTKLLTQLGVEAPSDVLGLRPGEALGCLHVEEAPGGCGTGEFCRTCGAVIAVMACQERGEPQEGECLLSARMDGEEVSLEFLVRATPLQLEGHRFTVITLQDIRAEKRREALQQIFFHDLLNLMTAVQGTCDSLTICNTEEMALLIRGVQRMTARLVDEVRAQRDLELMERGKYNLSEVEVRPAAIFDELRQTFEVHPAARDLTIEWPQEVEEISLGTDTSLLVRVLINMIKNALEATPAGGTIRVWCERWEESVAFRVWSPRQMPTPVALRVFQRYFSTKGPGRGLGTYSMRLIGQRYLGGRVSFTTSTEGTIFSLELPLRPTR